VEEKGQKKVQSRKVCGSEIILNTTAQKQQVGGISEERECISVGALLQICFTEGGRVYSRDEDISAGEYT
jgi:hypothetical protein